MAEDYLMRNSVRIQKLDVEEKNMLMLLMLIYK